MLNTIRYKHAIFFTVTTYWVLVTMIFPSARINEPQTAIEQINLTGSIFTASANLCDL